jgi:hypothetical protein
MHSALRRAIERGNLQAVLVALEHGADIEEADIHGDTGLPLRIACFKGYSAIAEELIRRGANINAANANGPGGPIRMAARGHHRDIVHLLMQHGAVLPADVQLPLDDGSERRKRVERRRRNLGAPSGLTDRRRAHDRRVTSVSELTLTDLQWDSYFTQSQPQAALPATHEMDDTVSMLFERVRD